MATGNIVTWMPPRANRPLLAAAAGVADAGGLRPELHQVALGDHPAQQIAFHDGNSRLPADEQRIGVTHRRAFGQHWQRRTRPLARALIVQPFAGGKALQQRVFGERADYAPILDDRQLRDAIAMEAADCLGYRIVWRN